MQDDGMFEQAMTIDDLTIKQAKDMMRPKLEDGVTCPCCGQNAQMYNRPLTSAMAYALILMYNAPMDNLTEEGYIHIENYFKSIKDLPSSIRGDVPKLRFWGLIKPWEGNTEDGNPNNGFYKITQLGKYFIELKVNVPPVARLYNNKFYGYKKDLQDISIVDALKKKFNYKELMQSNLTT